MMGLLLVGIFLIAFFMDVRVRVAVFNLPLVLFYLPKDIYKYFKEKKYNRAPEGLMCSYNAHFGGGKTLSAVEWIMYIYEQYNNKLVWCPERKKFVTQKIHIISNVKFKTIPCEELVSVSQVVCNAFKGKKIDEKNDTLTVFISFTDESSSEFNSRSFKSNIDPEFLRVLVTERHYHMNFIYTSQKFKLTDALMRSVTQTCIWCEKTWRFMVNYYYDADEMENVVDPTLLEPRKTIGWFIRDKHYNEYDTYAIVGKLKKSIDDGDMLSEEEILTLRGQLNTDMDAVTPSKKYIKRRKKMR